MTEAAVVQLEAQSHVTAEIGANLSPAYAESGTLQKAALRPGALSGSRRKLSLDDVRDLLRQDTSIFAHLMNGSSPFGVGFPVPASWKQDGEELALQLTHRLNALNDDENGITLVISCVGAYQKGRMDHLMIWNVSAAGGTLKLQTANQENIGGRHYPTDKVDTVELWQNLDPAGSKNSNDPGVPVDTFAKTAVGLSVAKHGLFINLFPSTASENFESAITLLSATEAGQKFGFFDGQKSCFTTARDLLGAIKTKGPRGEVVDWDAGKPQPVMPEILNKLSLLTNNERQIGIEAAQGKLYDLNDQSARAAVAADKAVFAELYAKLGGWINKTPGAYQLKIRPALQAH